jgi:hypothetical protein
MLPFVKDIITTVVAVDPEAATMLSKQLEGFDEVVKAHATDDPTVLTVGWTDKSISLLGRADLAKRPGLQSMLGEVKPLRLAGCLPKDTVAMLSLGLNDKTKERVTKSWLTSLPPSIQQAPFGIFGGQAVALLGDEVVLGVTRTNEGFPGLLLMAAMSNPEQTKGLIKSLAAITPQETYNEIEIGRLTVPLPISPLVAFAGDTLVLATNLDKLKATLDAFKAAGPSAFFASLDPPFQADLPRYGALIIHSDLVSNLLQFGLAAGAIPPEYQKILEKVAQVVKDLRATSDVRNNWQEFQLTLAFK